MENLMPYLFFGLGFIMIIKGSDWFIDATIWIAKVLKVPNIIIGATLVSICTTLPEAMVSGSSALMGNAEIAFGNALGSIACNTGFILAVSIIFSTPPIKERKKFQSTGKFLIGLIIFLIVNSLLFYQISRLTGIILLGVLVFYLIYNVRDSIKNPVDLDDTHENIDKSRNNIIRNIIFFVIGITLTIIGSKLLVTNGEIIAKSLGVPDIIIGLTLTAFGTSLPELVTSITAIMKNAHDISVGNILGANILNIIMVIGLSSTILPIEIKPEYIYFHLPFVLLIVCIPVVTSYINKNKFKKRNGFMLLASYFVYVYFMLANFS